MQENLCSGKYAILINKYRKKEKISLAFKHLWSYKEPAEEIRSTHNFWRPLKKKPSSVRLIPLFLQPKFGAALATTAEVGDLWHRGAAWALARAQADAPHLFSPPSQTGRCCLAVAELPAITINSLLFVPNEPCFRRRLLIDWSCSPGNRSDSSLCCVFFQDGSPRVQGEKKGKKKI